MKKGNTTKKLGRVHSHRKAMLNNMLTSLFEHEQIVTTRAKAKFLRPHAEKMITRAKKTLVDGVSAETVLHHKREVMRSIKDRDVSNKLMTEIAPRFQTRPGGYLRIIHLPERNSDSAQMSIIELVDRKAKTRRPRKELRAEAKPDVRAGEKADRKATGVPQREEKWYHRFSLGKKDKDSDKS